MRRLVYRALRLFSSLQRVLRDRLTIAGWLVLLGAAVAAAIGVDTTRAMSFQAFAVFVALLGVAALAAPLFRARVEVRRELPRYATAGQPVEYRVTVANRGNRPLAGATVADRLADPRPAYAAWRDAREPGEARRNRFDRHMGYFRWRWLIERRIPQPLREVPLPRLAPGAAREVKLQLVPRRRGRIELAGLALARPDPLGLVKGLVRVAAPARLTVLPHRYRLPRIALPGARRFQQGGVALAASVGDSEEFVALREYRPGDPLQRVHWKSFARAGKPVVKEFQDEFFERHALVLDTAFDVSASAEAETAFEEAVAIAASFVYAIDTQECLLDLLFVGAELHTFTAGRGQMRAEHLLEALAGVLPGRPEDFARLAEAVRVHRPRLTSCILVLLAWDEPRRGLVRALRASGLEVRPLVVCPRDAALDGGALALHPGEVEAGLAGLR